MGTLSGYKVIELAGIGPAPMAGMMLADMGAEVIRVERAGAMDPKLTKDVSFRGKKSVVLNLKSPEGAATLLRMVEKADVLIDPYRPGVCEKLGIGPDACFKANQKLIFGRMTGWGQDGPLAHAAGHDINYIALTGALYAVGTQGEKPVLPLNLVGDMGGGGMLLVNGILAALLEAGRSGKGQVVDAAMVDGAAQLMWMFHGFQAAGMWDSSERGANFLDGGAHFYDTYECSDGQYVAIGSIEPQFYAQLLEKTGVDPDRFKDQMNKSKWPEMKALLAEAIASKTRDEWTAIMQGTDVCFAPVLSFMEAPKHPANIARSTYIEVDGVTQPAPAPRFSRSPSKIQHGAHAIGADTDAVLSGMGFDASEISDLRSANIIS